MLNRLLRTAAIGMLALAATSAQAQLAGNKPLRFVVPFSAGGATDVIARLVASSMSNTLGKTIVIENKPGASGQIGTQQVKNAAPDSQMFLLTTEHPLVVLPHITPNVNYDARKDFTMVGKVVNLQWALSAPADSGVKTLDDFVARVRQDPLQGNYGIPFIGGVPSMIGSVLAQRNGIEMEPIPYAGGAPMVAHLMGGQIASGVTGSPEAATMQESGKVVVLGLAGSQRSPYLPNVPTFREQGYDNLDVDSWIALFSPSHVSPEVNEQLNAALRQALQEPEIQAKIADLSLQIAPTTVAEAAAQYDAAITFWNDTYAQQQP